MVVTAAARWRADDDHDDDRACALRRATRLCRPPGDGRAPPHRAHRIYLHILVSCVELEILLLVVETLILEIIISSELIVLFVRSY